MSAPASALPHRHEIPTELTWDLESIYPFDADWERDFVAVAQALPGLAAFQGRLGESGDALLRALRARDEAAGMLGRLFVYAQMRHHEDTTVSTYQALFDRVSTLANEFGATTAFMAPEILAIPEDRLREFLANTPGLDLYGHELDEVLRERAHVLSAEMEALLAQAGEMGSAPEHIYEMLENADLKLPAVRDEHGVETRLTQGNYVARFLESHDGRVRRDAFEAMLGTYRDFRNTLAATLAAQVKRDTFFARAHRYPSALEAALSPLNIPVSVYTTLVETVGRNLAPLHRYLELRKRVLGLDELHMYDLYVPLVQEVEYRVAYEEAQRTVAQALAPLGARYVEAAEAGFRRRWIDVMESEGKRSGAYSSGTYGTQPFILLNYQGNMDSMYTLAHELGHSMHSYLTWGTQPFPYGHYTLFLAEVASTLNEALLTHHLLRTTQDRALRLYVINHHLETIRTTLYRQTLFAEFEHEIHARSEAGEALTPDLLIAAYTAVNRKYYGGPVVVDDLIGYEWERIPHFYYTFYVYQYATGISASLALAQQILDEGQPAVDRYLRFLSSGSSDFSINLLRAAGVDMSSPEPVRRALDTFSTYVTEMEGLLGAS
jgi:oligoendopeptidase F